MANIEFKYPYNPSGTREDCKITKELVNLTLINGEAYQFVIPKRAPFFEKGLIVRSVSKNTVLEIDTDFILTHKFKSATEYLNKKIFGSITFLDKDLSGEVELSYSTLGGDFTTKKDIALVQIINNLMGHRIIDWDDILDKPVTFPPSQHVHSPDQIMDMNDVIESLDQIAAILRGDEYPNHRHTMDQIEGLFEALSEKADNTLYVVFAPIPPIKITGYGKVIALRLPKVLSETAMRIEIWINNGLESSELSVIGLLEKDMPEYGEWTGLQVRADNTIFTDTVGGSYDIDGNPILYLHSSDDKAWSDVTFTIPKVIYSKMMSNNISGIYGYSDATTLKGKIVNIDRYIYQSQYIILENRLHRVKLNTILNEIIYDII